MRKIIFTVAVGAASAALMACGEQKPQAPSVEKALGQANGTIDTSQLFQAESLKYKAPRNGGAASAGSTNERRP